MSDPNFVEQLLELQDKFSNLQAATKEERNEDRANLDGQISHMLQKWPTKLTAGSSEASPPDIQGLSLEENEVNEPKSLEDLAKDALNSLLLEVEKQKGFYKHSALTLDGFITCFQNYYTLEEMKEYMAKHHNSLPSYVEDVFHCKVSGEHRSAYLQYSSRLAKQRANVSSTSGSSRAKNQKKRR